MSKYDPLTRHLKSARSGRVPMAFDEIEAVLGFHLPKSARKHRPWWSNHADGTHVQARAWLSAGYQATEVDMAAERLMFVKLNEGEPSAGPARQEGDETRTGKSGRHPLLGAMAGTVRIPAGVDLTEPMWTDDEIEQSLSETARLLAEDLAE